MKKMFIKVLGMTCSSCQQKIYHVIKQRSGVVEVSVSLERNLVELLFEDSIVAIDDIINDITDLGYKTNHEMVFANEEDLKKSKLNKLYNIIKIFLIILLIYFFIKRVFGFDFINMIPEIDSSISYPLLFIIGLMTSIHCVGMCGAFNLAASSGLKIKNPYKRPLLYNLGRVISYTITGGLAGLLGRILAPSLFMQGLMVAIASLFMLLLGLSMLGVISHKIFSMIPKAKIKKGKTTSPLMIGLLNGFMPCGPLQAMQVYAISTASFILGATSMFLFALGTVPLMFLVGFIFNFVKGKKVYMMQRISAALVIMLAFVMFNRSMGYLGINLFDNNSNYEIAEMKGDYQYVEIDVKNGSYQRIVVQVNIPVQFNLKANEGSLNGCNNPIMIPSYDIQRKLFIGDNIVYFTPNAVGNVSYSCWMSMIKSQIIVVDDINNYK